MKDMDPKKQKLADEILASSWDDTGGWRECTFMNLVGMCMGRGHKRHMRKKINGKWVWYWKNSSPTKIPKRK